MSSVRVMEKYPTEHNKVRPSVLGHFFSRIGSLRHRSRSPRNPSFSPEYTQPKRPANLLENTEKCAVKNGTKNVEKVLNVENELHLLSPSSPSSSPSSPPPKPKRRHSSPFVRIIHRFSMNRKNREMSAVNHKPDSNNTDLDQSKLNGSFETVYSTSTPSTVYALGTDVLSRPTVSENDLRLLTLQKDQEMERSVTALSMNTSDIYSDDNLRAVTRVPSYLRISCTLNGYRRPYRRFDEFCRRPNATDQKLPMGIVEARTLAFMQTDQKNITLDDVTNRNNSQMGDDISKINVQVRQLVERFDRMHKDDENGEPENMGEEDSNHVKNTMEMDETHTTTPLKHPVAPQNSIALSGQLYGAAYSHTSPKPSIAQRMHRALLKTTMESEPHVNNQAEIRIENGQSSNKQVAKKVKNENGINFALPDGEAYRNLLTEAAISLQAHCDEAKMDLKNEESLPEYAAGMLRTAVGKANLLLDKKMAKFEELVKQHLDGQVNDVQQVTLSDLSGYWALISIELKELEDKFGEIRLLRKNAWLPEPKAPPVSTATVNENRGDFVKKIRPPSPIICGEKMAQEAHRRQTALAAAKRRQKELMKLQKQAQNGETSGGGGGAARMVI